MQDISSLSSPVAIAITIVYHSGSSVIPLSIVIQWRIESVELESPLPSISPNASNTNLKAFSKNCLEWGMTRLLSVYLLLFGAQVVNCCWEILFLALWTELNHASASASDQTDKYWGEEEKGVVLVLQMHC